jgi:hypothetical protein
MLDRETEEHWRAVKESYPDSIVFHEAQGLLVVTGRDTEVLAKEFGIKPGSAWLGFDEDGACGYMMELVNRGYAVVRASAQRVSCLRRPIDKRKEIRRQQAKGRFLAMEPTLVFDRSEIERATTESWLRKRGYEELFESFKRWLQVGDWRSLREFGELFVYQVGDWYEVDLELTSMLEGHALLLAKAAVATGCKLPSRVVEPKCRRERQRRRRPPQSVAPNENGHRLGQLTFDDVLSGWSVWSATGVK